MGPLPDKMEIDDDPPYRTAGQGRQARRSARLRLQALHLQELRVLSTAERKQGFA